MNILKTLRLFMTRWQESVRRSNSLGQVELRHRETHRWDRRKHIIRVVEVIHHCRERVIFTGSRVCVATARGEVEQMFEIGGYNVNAGTMVRIAY